MRMGSFLIRQNRTLLRGKPELKQPQVPGTEERPREDTVRGSIRAHRRGASTDTHPAGTSIVGPASGLEGGQFLSARHTAWRLSGRSSSDQHNTIHSWLKQKAL